MSRFGDIGRQYFDNAGDPLVSGKLYFYSSGTDTLKTTYADSSLTIANSNPVVLTAAGRQPNIFFSGTAKVILTDADSVQIEVRDPVGGDTTDSAFADWTSSAVYNIPDIVRGSDENYYMSISDANIGNDPTTSPANWTQIDLIKVYNANEIYGLGDLVKGSDNLLYKSNITANTSDPVTNSINWSPAASASTEPAVRAAGFIYALQNF